MDEVEKIKERLDIVDVISSYLTLKRAGTNMKAACPFHNEKTPSFMVSPERQSFKCFGCGEGGDVFTFIEKIEGVDFYNALKILADRAGVKLEKKYKVGKREFSSDLKTKLFEINDWATKVYHKVLVDHPKADKARKYLEGRGLGEEIIDEFKIGYAPDSWDFLLRFMRNKGYSDKEVFQAGCAVLGKKDSYYDRFRGRIVFPISDVMGNPVAFTSRILNDQKDQPKYINSSDSKIYHKGKVLYGLDKAKLEIKSEDLVVLVEGNMDVIACHQAGFKNVVASSGTAITKEQINVLTRYTREIAFSFDNDEAGIAAMKKAVKMALSLDVTAKIISLPYPYKDPDEAITADPKNWQRALGSAKPALEHWIDLLIKNSPNLDVSNKKKIAREILPVIKEIFSDIEKEHYIKYLSDKLALSEASLISSMQKARKDRDMKNFSEKEEDGSQQKTSITLDDRLVGFLSMSEGAFEELEKEDQSFLKEKAKQSPLLAAVIDDKKLSRDERSKLDSIVLALEEEFDEANQGAITDELKVLIGRTKSSDLEDIKAEYSRKIKDAEKSGDKKRAKALLLELQELIK